MHWIYRNKPTVDGYQSASNITVTGGTWKSASTTGTTSSMIQFTHASNITLKDMTVSANYEGHSIELIACKNVLVNNCTLIPLGSPRPGSVEEQLQIDIATPGTAPTVYSINPNLTKGQTCENITVTHCTITGARGVCANFSSRQKAYRKKYHKNIVITNNTLIGTQSEALVLYNALGVTVENNTIISSGARLSSGYSTGMHVTMVAKPPVSVKKSNVVIRNNVIKGKQNALQISSNAGGKQRVKNNKKYKWKR